MGKATWGVAVPLDPGEHHLEASAPGRKTWSATVTIGAAGDQREVTVPLLDLVDAPVADAPPPSAPPAPSPPLERPPAQGSGRTQRTVGVALGAAGVVVLGVGAYFGVRAMSNASGADQACPNTTCTNAAGIAENNDAKSNARLADVVLPLGLAATVTGSLLYFLAPRGIRVDPVVGTVNGVRVETAW